MTDDDLLSAFEFATRPADQFTHEAHVRVAWCYLRRHPLPLALAAFSNGLKRYAAANRAAGKYHETITVAYMLLIADRMAESGSHTWEEFARCSPDLLARHPSPLTRYYSPDVLASDRARRTFVMPDAPCAAPPRWRPSHRRT